MPTVLCLMGPTATGKTALALTIAAQFPVEIISIDSTNVYRGMDIGTAKPSASEQAQVPHHLIDIRDPWDSYSAGQCCLDARECIQTILAKGKIPLLVGGTMLYFQTLLRGYDGGPTTSPAVRQQVLADAERLGWKALWQRLYEINPAAANALHPNDKQRIGRALEREMVLQSHPTAPANTIPALQSELNVVQIALMAENRQLLRDRIAARLETMLQAGFIDEVSQLLDHPKIEPNLPAMRSVGYAQVCQHLAGELDSEALTERIRIATNQLAKRQHTWLNQFPKAFKNNCFDDNTTKRVLHHIDSALA